MDEAVEKLGDHKPAGPLRGGKYSRYEGGTRVPLIVRWPGEVKANTTSDALISQVDFLASFAELAKVEPAKGAAQDSQNQLPELLGKHGLGRVTLVEQANGLALRIRQWKYIEGGGKQRPKNKAGTEQAIGGELYDLSNDLGERNNLIDERPELAQGMQEILDKIRADKQ